MTQLHTLARWRRVVLHWPKAQDFWPSASPSCPPTVLSNLVFQWSVHPNSLTLRPATCKLDNLDFAVTAFLTLYWMTYNWRISTMRIKRMSGGISAHLSIFKTAIFPKITWVVRMLHDLCKKFFTRVGKFFSWEKVLEA